MADDPFPERPPIVGIGVGGRSDTGGHTLSVAVVPGDLAGGDPAEASRSALISALFSPHRRVEVRLGDGLVGPRFCTCGDLWPCRVEEAAARILDPPD